MRVAVGLLFAGLLGVFLVIAFQDSIRWHQQRALSMAAREGDFLKLRLLILTGADINRPFGGGRGALSSALMMKNKGMVEFLLNRGADVNIHEKLTSPLIIAVQTGRLDFVEMLLVRGADIAFQGDDGTALMIASAKGHKEIVRLLLERGAGENEEGSKALRQAVINQHSAVVQLLLSDGVNVNDLSEHDRLDGFPSILKVAREKGNEAIIAMLIRAGAKD